MKEGRLSVGDDADKGLSRGPNHFVWPNTHFSFRLAIKRRRRDLRETTTGWGHWLCKDACGRCGKGSRVAAYQMEGAEATSSGTCGTHAAQQLINSYPRELLLSQSCHQKTQRICKNPSPIWDRLIFNKIKGKTWRTSSNDDIGCSTFVSWCHGVSEDLLWWADNRRVWNE